MRMYGSCVLVLGLIGLAVCARHCRADQVVYTADGFGTDAD